MGRATPAHWLAVLCVCRSALWLLLTPIEARGSCYTTCWGLQVHYLNTDSALLAEQAAKLPPMIIPPEPWQDCNTVQSAAVPGAQPSQTGPPRTLACGNLLHATLRRRVVCHPDPFACLLPAAAFPTHPRSGRLPDLPRLDDAHALVVAREGAPARRQGAVPGGAGRAQRPGHNAMVGTRGQLGGAQACAQGVARPLPFAIAAAHQRAACTLRRASTRACRGGLTHPAAMRGGALPPPPGASTARCLMSWRRCTAPSP